MGADGSRLHEDYHRVEKVEIGSDRRFGLVFCLAFAVIALWPVTAAAPPRGWALMVAVTFLAASLVKPNLLAPLNRLWLRFGLFLHRLIGPLLLALIFYVTVTPTGLIVRLLGKDPLKLRFDSEATSYWKDRRPSGPKPETMRKQF